MGFIKLPRELTRWGWYGDNDMLSVYVRLLLKAAWARSEYKGVELERGQLVTTVAELASENGLSVRQIRTVLDRLKATNKITVTSTTKFSIITLLEYDSQPDEQPTE